MKKLLYKMFGKIPKDGSLSNHILRLRKKAEITMFYKAMWKAWSIQIKEANKF